MEAVVTLKGRPDEFDLIRRALAAYHQAQLDSAHGPAGDPAVRREARAEALTAAELLAKLR